jgi:hypothetical protein
MASSRTTSSEGNIIAFPEIRRFCIIAMSVEPREMTTPPTGGGY